MNLVTQAAKLSPPVVGAGASFNANQAGGQLGEERQHLGPTHLSADHHLASHVDAMHRNTDLAISRPIVTA